MIYYMPIDKCRKGTLVRFRHGLVKFIEYGGRQYILSNDRNMNGDSPPRSLMEGFEYGWVNNRPSGQPALFDIDSCCVTRKTLERIMRNWNRTTPEFRHREYNAVLLRAERIRRTTPLPEKSIQKCHFTGKYFREVDLSRTFHYMDTLIKVHPSIDVGGCAISGVNVYVGYNGVRLDGDYCHEEYADRIITCSDCGKEFVNVDELTNTSGLPICRDCDSNYFYCSSCNDVFHVDQESEEAGLCHECFDERYAICHVCGEICDRDDYDYDIGCPDCARGVISDYSTRFPEKTYGDERRFGVEIELECQYSDRYCNARDMKQVAADCLIKSDGSLDNGFEVVTPPLLYQDAIDISRKIVNKASEMNMWADCDEDYDAKGEQTCGVHVHVSKASITQHTLAKILLVFSECKEDVERIARRNCDEWACVFKKEKNKLIENEDKFVEDVKSTRYTAINLRNHNTAEFRIFKGTVNPSYIEAYIQFVDCLCDACEKITIEDIDEHITMAKVLEPLINKEKYSVLKKYLKLVEVIN